MNKFKAYYLVFIISLFSMLTAENDYYYFYNLNAGANLLSFPLETENNEIELLNEDLLGIAAGFNLLKDKNSSEWREYATRCMIDIMDNKTKV